MWKRTKTKHPTRTDLALKLRAALTAKLSKAREAEADIDPEVENERQRIAQRLRCEDLPESERTADAKARRALSCINDALGFRHLADNEYRGCTAAEISFRAYEAMILETVQRETGITISAEQPRRHEQQPGVQHGMHARCTVELWTGASDHIADRIAKGHSKGGLYVRTREGRGGGERWLGHCLIKQLRISEASATATIQLWGREQLIVPAAYDRPNGRLGHGIKLIDHVECLPVVLVGTDQLDETLLREAAPVQYAETD